MTVEWEKLKLRRECAAYELSISMYYGALEYKREVWHLKHKEACNKIARYQSIAEAVAEMCIQYNLPSGDPPWMCQLIMSY